MCLKNRFSALNTGLMTSVARCTALSCDFDPERRRKIDCNCPFCFLYEKSGLIATAIDGMLETTQEQLETLESVRPKPYVLDDHTVARLIRSFTIQLNDLGLYQEQVSQVEAS